MRGDSLERALMEGLCAAPQFDPASALAGLIASGVAQTIFQGDLP
jgi:hypothetical protein